MAITIGVFEDIKHVTAAIIKMRRLGILKENVALLAEEAPANKERGLSMHVSGYLEYDARQGEVRTVQEGVHLALSREGLDREDMLVWMSELAPRNAVLIVRSRGDQAPWVAESMRRAGAKLAIDSETQAEMDMVKEGRPWRRTVREAMGA